MITPSEIAEKIIEYLNGHITLPTLVDWAETTLLSISENEGEIEGEPQIMQILGYIGAGDMPNFPLTWETLSKFLDQLGTSVYVTRKTVSG
jgi:2'-5' RNA ligase